MTAIDTIDTIETDETDDGASLQKAPDTGFALRGNPDGPPRVPATPPFAMCPDIIRSGEKSSDPQEDFTTQDSLGKLYDCDPNPEGANYYYVRALNKGLPTKDALFSCYAGPLQLIPFPQFWRDLPLKTGSGETTSPGSAAKGHYAVGTEPFLLPSPSADLGTFVGMTSVRPPKVPEVTSWLEMSNLITQTLAIGFNSVAYLDAAKPATVTPVVLGAPASFSDAGTIRIDITSSGFDGCKIGMVADRFADDGTLILFKPSDLTDDGVLGFQFSLPPGFEANLTIQIFGGAAGVKPGSTVTVTASYVVPKHKMDEAFELAAVDSRYTRHLERPSTSLQVGPTVLLPLGAVTFVAQ